MRNIAQCTHLAKTEIVFSLIIIITKQVAETVVARQVARKLRSRCKGAFLYHETLEVSNLKRYLIAIASVFTSRIEQTAF